MIVCPSIFHAHYFHATNHTWHLGKRCDELYCYPVQHRAWEGNRDQTEADINTMYEALGYENTAPELTRHDQEHGMYEENQ